MRWGARTTERSEQQSVGRRRFARSVGLVVALLLTTTPLAAQQVTGTVRDAGSRDAIPFATVSLLTPGGTALVRVAADSAGRFTIRAPNPGAYRLEVRQIGYAARAPRELLLAAGQVTEVEVLLSTEPVALEAVVVETRSRREREQVARGTPLRLLTREDIEEIEKRSNPPPAPPSRHNPLPRCRLTAGPRPTITPDPDDTHATPPHPPRPQPAPGPGLRL